MELDHRRAIIGRNVKAARIRAGFNSIRSFSKVLSFSRDHLSKIEAGKVTASLSHLREIASLTGVPVETLQIEDHENKERVEFIEKVIREGGDFDQASSVADELIHNAIAGEELANAYRLKGNVLLKQGRYRASIETYEKALACGEYRSDNNMKARIAGNIALCMYHLRLFDKAHIWCSTSANWTIDNNHLLYIQQLRANIYAKTEEYELALNIHQELLEHHASLKNVKYVLMAHQNIGDIFLSLNDLSAAKKNLCEAFKIALSQNYIDEASRTAIALSDVYLRSNEINKANAILLSIVEMKSRLSAPFKAKILYAYSNLEQSVECRKELLLEAFEISSNLDDDLLKENIAFDLAEIFDSENNLIEAVKYYKIRSHRKGG